MARSRWGARFRVVFVTVAAIVLFLCLLGILLTGPVVIRVPALDTGARPSTQRLKQAVEKLCTEFAPRDYLHVENLNATADWIAASFREAGLDVEIQEYELDEGRYRNVIGHQAGTGAGNGAIVIGAHYDVYGGFPGADDNASSVAVLLELVRTRPQESARRDRYFVAFSTEEPPFFRTEDMGSFRFARKLVEDGTEVELMVAMDMVGFFSDAPHSQGFPFPGLGLLYPDRADFIAVVGDLTSGRAIGRVKRAMMSTRVIDVHSFRAPKWVPGVDWSDHISFRRLGMPGVLVTDTSFMRYTHYHTHEDTPDKLDYERMAQVVQALHGVLWESSQAEGG